MDWKVFGSAFTALFLAEMGDKTQLAVIALSASTRRPWSVAAGAVLALATVAVLGALVGHGLGQWIPRRTIERIAAGAFVVTGVVMWLRAGGE